MNLRKLRIVAAGMLVLAVGLLIDSLAVRAAADTYQVDPVHSFVTFRVKHMGVGYAYGRFGDLSGNFMFDDANPAGLTFDLVVKTESVDTGNAKRDQHLKGPDFFNVKAFPTITFKSQNVRRSGDKSFDVSGDLTMHGVTRPVSFKLDWVGSAKDPSGVSHSGFEATFAINRGEFGMKYGLDGTLGDDVRIMVAFEGVKK